MSRETPEVCSFFFDFAACFLPQIVLVVVLRSRPFPSSTSEWVLPIMKIVKIAMWFIGYGHDSYPYVDTI
jgi:hypothetical protein